MKIENIDNSDIEITKILLEKLYIELGEERESLEFLNKKLIAKLISNGRTTILKATLNKKVVGIMTLTESQAIYSGGYFGSIDEMYVEQVYRSQKIGEQLIKKAIEIAKEKKWNRMDVTAPADGNTATLNFYKKNNFMFTGSKLKLKIN